MIGPAEILRARILLVDDNEDNVRLLQQLLQHAGYTHVYATTDPHQVFPLHSQDRFDLIVLDLLMPGMDGFEVMEALKTIEKEYLPVLAVTGESDHKLRALQAGAKDFVSKPFDWDEVLMRVHNMLEVRLLHDEAREHARLLESLALQDPLTGLANRRLLPERVWMAIAHARRNRSAMAVVYLDLDGFKDVNDTLGHAAGDLLLKTVAARLLGAVREEDTVARVGGDEFMIALWHVIGVDDTAMVAEKLVNAIAQPYEIEGRTVTVTISAGASIYPVHGEDADALMKTADLALYKAKHAGKNTFRLADDLS
ncbi:MAG: response regulator receiver modulated diguanylate cyclase [Betaproteobacteria bacterium]|jgi:two-component system cell cycle response regulator|nr:response regulator receiver modulated diguanylate cyclase [Betaproteobacteria bacterium]